MRWFRSLAWLLVAVLIIPMSRGRGALSSLLMIAAIRSAAEVKVVVSVACLTRLFTSFSFVLMSNSCRGRWMAFVTNWRRRFKTSLCAVGVVSVMGGGVALMYSKSTRVLSLNVWSVLSRCGEVGVSVRTWRRVYPYRLLYGSHIWSWFCWGQVLSDLDSDDWADVPSLPVWGVASSVISCGWVVGACWKCGGVTVGRLGGSTCLGFKVSLICYRSLIFRMKIFQLLA